MANYLYNGVELPDINEVWTDKETYPYACISQLLINDAVNMYGYKYILLISSTQFFKITNDSCGTNDRMSLAQVYTLKNLSWGFEEQHDGEMSCENESLKCIWTSHDIYSLLDLTIHLAASEPTPITAPALDPLSMWLGWKAGNWVARQRGKKVEEEKTPVAYLYNGVQLPDINAVWTDKETYPYAAVVLPVPQGYQDLYALCIAGDIPTTVHNDTFGSTLVLEVGTEVKTYILATTQEAANIWGISEANVWIWNEDFTTKEGEYLYIIDKVTWASHDVLNEDGTIYLAASEPVPVYE